MSRHASHLRPTRPLALSIAFGVLIWTASTQVGFAQKQLDAELGDRGILLNDLAVTHPIASWLNLGTVMVGEIDLSSVDVDASFRWLNHMTSWRSPDALTIRGMQQTIQDARSDRIYLLGHTSTLKGTLPLFLIPDGRDDVLGMLVQRLRPKELGITDHKDSLIVASATEVQSLQSMGTKLRPELIFPLRDGARLDHTLVVAMPWSMRNSFKENLPEEGPEFLPFDFSPRKLFLGVDQWIVSVQLPPDPVVRLTAKCASPEDTTRTHEIAIRLVKESEPSLSEIHVQRKGLRVILSLDSVALEQLRPVVSQFLKSEP